MASNYPASSAAGGGETGSNLGAGVGVYDSKAGNVLQFRSLVPGTGVSLSATSSEVTAAVPGTDVSLASAGGTSLVAAGSGPALQIKGLSSGAGASVTSGASDLTVAFSGQANTASNLGAGAQIASTKSGVDLPFRSLVAGSGVTVTQDAPSAGNIQVALTLSASSAPWVFARSLATGTAGGAVTPNTWTVAPFDTASGNSATDVQLAAAPAGSNQFLVANGTYEVYAKCFMNRASGFKLRLYNVTDAATALYGSSERNPTTSSASAQIGTSSRVIGALTVTGGPKVFQFELYHTNSSSDATNMGVPMSTAPYPEVYNYATFAKQLP